jgi:hypothetical protein
LTKNAGIQIDVFCRFNGFLFLTTDNAPGFSSTEADADIAFPAGIVTVGTSTEQSKAHRLPDVLVFRHGDADGLLMMLACFSDNEVKGERWEARDRRRDESSLILLS